MSTTGLVPVVESVVDSKVQGSDMFTAHDVTLEVRNRGHRVGHAEVRDAVHDYYQRGGLGIGYSRTNISVPGGNPYLYYPSNADPNTYSNIRGMGVSPTTPSGNYQTIPVPPAGNSSDDDDDDDDGSLASAVSIPSSLISSVAGVAVNGNRNGKHSANKAGVTSARAVDGRSTLSIPAPVVRKVFKVGQKVYAVASADGVEVVDQQPPAASVYGKYTVDSHCQVRITQSLLQRAGIGGTSYDVEESGNKVVVKLHK